MRPLLACLLLTGLLAASARAGVVSVDVFSRTVDTSRLRVVFDADRPEVVRQLLFKDWSVQNDIAGLQTSASEFWGGSYRGEDSTGFVQPFQQEFATWQLVSSSPRYAMLRITSASTFQPSVETLYHFYADQPFFVIERTVHFADVPDSSSYQPYIARISFQNTYRALRFRNAIGDSVQRGYCFGGCETESWDGRWLQHIGYTGAVGVSVAQIYKGTLPTATFVRGYGPTSFAGWASPLLPATPHTGDETTSFMMAFSTHPEQLAPIDSLWAQFQDGRYALDVPAPSTGAPLAFSASPNPTRGGTRLAWAQSRAGAVTLEVLDLAGRRVARLADGAFDAGAHALAWDGRDAAGALRPPGLYLARLVTPEGSRVVRIAVTR